MLSRDASKNLPSEDKNKDHNEEYIEAEAKEMIEQISMDEMSKIALFTMINTSKDYIFVKDRDERYILASPAIVRMFGFDDFSQLSGKTNYDFIDTERADAFQKIDNHILNTGEAVVDREEFLPTRDGSIKHCLISRHPMRDQKGNVVGILGYSRDVTTEHEKDMLLRQRDRENRIAIVQSGLIISRYDIASHTLSIPKELADSSGIEETLYGVPYAQINDGTILPDSANKYINFFEEIESGQKEGSAVYHIKIKGEPRWFEAKYSTIFDEYEKPVLAVVSYVDISDRLEKEAIYTRWQQSLEGKHADSYTLLVSNINSTGKNSYKRKEGELIKIDLPSSLITFNERAAAFARKCIYPDDRARFLSAVNSDKMLINYVRGKRTNQLNIRELLEDGTSRWIRLSIDLVQTSNLEGVIAYMMFENIDDEKRHEIKLKAQAEMDFLTGVLNRSTFETRVRKTLNRTHYSAINALMLIDIDNFKKINDDMGHDIGDKVLKDITWSISELLRRDDLFGRIGGDEFMILLKNIPNISVAEFKAREICTAVSNNSSDELQISASIGISITPDDGSDYDVLYKKSDKALYESKRKGKNTFTVYEDETI